MLYLLVNRQAKVSTDLLIQQAIIIILLVERRKVAWDKMNLKLRNLGMEDYGGRGTDPFRPGLN